jgi:hypothetical protein
MAGMCGCQCYPTAKIGLAQGEILGLSVSDYLLGIRCDEKVK